jgi:hypothetical protein
MNFKNMHFYNNCIRNYNTLENKFQKKSPKYQFGAHNLFFL